MYRHRLPSSNTNSNDLRASGATEPENNIHVDVTVLLMFHILTFKSMHLTNNSP